MPVESLEDVRSYNENARNKLLARVRNCPSELLNWEPATGKWSVLQHLEHMALSEPAFVRRIRVLAERARRSGALYQAGSPRTVDARPALAPLAGVPARATEDLIPSGRPLPEILAMLTASRAEFHEALSGLAEIDTDQIRFPFRGQEINLAQFAHLIGLHELIHERHIAVNQEAWVAAAPQENSWRRSPHGNAHPTRPV